MSLTLHCSKLRSGSACHSGKTKVLTVIHKPFHPPNSTVAFAPAHPPPHSSDCLTLLSSTRWVESHWPNCSFSVIPGAVPTLGLCACSGYLLELSSPGCLTAQLPHSSAFTQMPPSHGPLPGHPLPRHKLTNTNS